MSRTSRWFSLLPLALLMAGCAPARAATPEPGTARPAPAAPAAAAADTGTVVVTGTASVSVAADRARIRFAVERQAATAAQAVAANAAAMDEALSAVRQALGGAGTLETSGYGLSPVYRQPPRDQGGEPTIVAYRAVNHVEVTVNRVDDVGRILDAAVGAGANRIAGLSFYASDTRDARLEALRQATAKARDEARVLAESLGVPLGAPLQVQSSAEMPTPQPQMFRAMEAAPMATPTEAGEQEVSATVTITYRLGG